MNKGKLTTAVLGLNDDGRLLLEAASPIDSFDIQAVADGDTRLAEHVATQYECAGYDDYRQLVMQNELDCLLVPAGMHSRDEYVRMAMKKKCHVLKLAPMARNSEEARALVKLAGDQGVTFAVGNPGRYADSFMALHDYLQRNDAGDILMVSAFCSVGGAAEAWLTDPELAGGGVLLHNCYAIVDQLVWNLGVPEQVYALTTSQAVDKQQRLYLTEDTAVVAMRFSDTLVGALQAFRQAQTTPRQEHITVYGKDRILTISKTAFSVGDRAEEEPEQVLYEYDAVDCAAKMLSDFAQSILSPKGNEFVSTGRENLRHMAVIEAAYLSAHTGFPEEPGRILQMASGLLDGPTSG
jgi:predicted dehydrogenase